MERGKKFIKDIFIYAVGNLGSKLITFLLVPLYTYFISPDDFGYYDIALNISFLGVGVLSLQLRDGVFRFLLDNEDERIRRDIVSFTFRFLLKSTLVALVIGLFCFLFYEIRFLPWIVALTVVFMFYEIYIQVIRGLGKNVYFVYIGILTSFLTIGFSCLFIVWLGCGVLGIFYANILSRVLSMFFIECKLGILKRYFRYNFSDPQINKDIIKYSLPLLPNALCWWILGSSNRLFIDHYLGLESNGIYAVAMKFASILETFSLIIYQAWQETAIKQYGSQDKNSFFSSVLYAQMYIFSAFVIFAVFMIKWNYGWLVDDNFQESAQYLFPLGISVIFFSLTSFFDMGYQCSKETARNLPGVLLATGVNLLLNFLLIQRWGIGGIVASSILTYLSLFLYRMVDSRRFFRVKIPYAGMIPLAGCVVAGIIYYTVSDLYLQIIYVVILMAVLGVAMPAYVKSQLTSLILSKLHKKRTL